MKLRILVLIAALIMSLTFTVFAYSQNSLNAIYEDESHCLVGPEIEGEKDKPISCYCRDAIVDARYVWSTYLIAGKDQNLNGSYLTLWSNVEKMCGNRRNDFENANWHWNGPEIRREYPTNQEVQKIQPDKNGFRIVKYKFDILYSDSKKNQSRIAFEKVPAK
jgi:hypothetical protein